MVRSTHLRKKTEPRKLRNYNSSRQSLTRTVSALSCLSRSSSRTCLTRPAEVSTDELERCTDKSSETQSQSNLSAVSLEQDRTFGGNNAITLTHDARALELPGAAHPR